MPLKIIELTELEMRLLNQVADDAGLSNLFDEKLIEQLQDKNFSQISRLLSAELKTLNSLIDRLGRTSPPFILFDSRQIALIRKLTSALPDRLETNLGYLLTIKVDDYAKQPGVGRKKVNTLLQVQEKIRRRQDDMESAAPQNELKTAEDIGITSIESTITQILDNLFAVASHTRATLMKAKYGYAQDTKTVRETCTELNISESRGSQIITDYEREIQENSYIPFKLRSDFWNTNKLKNPRDVFPELSKSFISTRRFVDLIRLLIGLDSSVSSGLANTSDDFNHVSKTALNAIFSEVTLPAPLAVFHSKLNKTENLSGEILWSILAQAIDSHLITVEGDLVVSAEINSSAALANTLLNHPDGLTTEELIRHAEKTLNEKLSAENVIRSCNDHSYIYKMDPHKYRHRSFFTASDLEFEQVRKMCQISNQSDSDEPSDIFTFLAWHADGRAIDPYDFAEIYRRLVETGTPNLMRFKSLHAVSFNDRERQLLYIINSARSGLTNRQISELTALDPVYTRKILTQLVADRKITRVGKQTYLSNKHLLEGVDPQLLRSRISEQLDKLGKIVEISYLAACMNQTLGVNLPQEAYLAIAKLKGEREIFVQKNLLSLSPLKFKSLRDLVHTYFEELQDDHEVISRICEDIYLTSATITHIRHQLLPVVRRELEGRVSFLKTAI